MAAGVINRQSFAKSTEERMTRSLRRVIFDWRGKDLMRNRFPLRGLAVETQYDAAILALDI